MRRGIWLALQAQQNIPATGVRMTTQPTPEQLFLQYLDALARDARAAARYAYVGSTINFTAGNSPPIVDLLNQDAGFWNTALGSLRTASIVALGRICDTRKNVLSASH